MLQVTHLKVLLFLLRCLSGHQERAGPLLKPRSAFLGGLPRREAESGSAGPEDGGEPKPFRAAKRKQKTAVLPGAARLLLAVKRSSARETTVQIKG